MKRKTLLFLTAVDCQVCTSKNGELSDLQSFIDDAQGQEKFAAYLQLHRDPAYLLTDLVEEDFRHETVPHLRGSERTALIRRKLEQCYRNTPFRQAVALQRHKDGRRDDDILFSALTNPALITPWLNILQSHNIPLAGIYSIPNISVPLMKDISSGCLLLSWEKHAGLRQTYFDANRLHFSRLTPINQGSSFVETAGTEATRTQQYLKNLSLLPPGESLNVTIICHVDDRQKLETQLVDDGNMHYSYLDIQGLGQHLGSKAVYDNSDATRLFLYLLATQRPCGHYASDEQTHLLKLLQLSRGLFGLSAVCITASLLWAAVNVREGLMYENEEQIFKAQTGKLSQQTGEIIQSFPGTQASATDMKIAVMLSRQLNNAFPPPQILLDGLAKTLDGFPTLRIDKLSWQKNSPGSGEASAAPKENTAVIIPAQIILLSGELMEFTGSYRSALGTMERLQQALIQRGYGVTALSLPLDISPQGSIAADTCDGSIKPARFSLKISWRTEI